MDKKPTTLGPPQNHFLDIHEVLPEEDEERMMKEEDKVDKHLNRPNKVREMKKPHRSFNRQVSLETGFSVLNRENKVKNERKALTRSGTSFDSAHMIGLEGRKGDFSIFKTKSTLSKQNSLLPRKERELETQRGNGSGGNDDSVNASVPAGRYFDALRGPELDEVKVRNTTKLQVACYIASYFLVIAIWVLTGNCVPLKVVIVS